MFLKFDNNRFVGIGRNVRCGVLEVIDGKTNRYDNAFGTFLYRAVPVDVSPPAVASIADGVYSYTLAPPATPLCHTLS